MEEEEIAFIVGQQNAMLGCRMKKVRGITGALQSLLARVRDVISSRMHQLDELKRDIMVRVERRHPR